MTAVNYLWNPLNDNVVREFDDAVAVVAEYTTEPEEFGNLISQRRDGEDDYFHFDGIGSTLAVTNQAGTVTDTRAYTAFGETSEQSGTTAFPFQYVGRKGYFFDQELNSLAVRRRTLYPRHGRWLSVDPLYLRMNNQQRFVYVASNPTNRIDPTGMVPIRVCFDIFDYCIARAELDYEACVINRDYGLVSRILCYLEYQTQLGNCDREFIACVLTSDEVLPLLVAGLAAAAVVAALAACLAEPTPACEAAFLAWLSAAAKQGTCR
jgi:RHS repeat-associated protein